MTTAQQEGVMAQKYSRPGFENRPNIYDSLIRISRVGDRKKDGSLMSDADQAKRNEYVIHGLGARVGVSYEAPGESGSTIFTSDKWQAALERVRRGESRGVVADLPDRFGRNVQGAYAYAAALYLAGGVLVLNGRPVDYENAQDKALFGMAMVQAEMTYDLAVERSLRTRDRVRERGITLRMPFGYMRNRQPDGTLVLPDEDPKRLVPDPEKAWIVKRLFSMRAEGAQFPTCQRWLEEQGITSPTGRPMWTLSSIRTVIMNRRYIGEVSISGHVTVDAHEPLVTEEVFELAQPGSGVIRNGKNIAGISGGLVVCKSCGRVCSTGGTAGRAPFYTCRRTWSGGRCPSPMMGKMSRIDEAVEARLRELAEDGRWEILAVRTQRELADAREALVAAERRLARFVDAFDADDDEDVTAIRARKATLKADVAATKERVAIAEAAASGMAEFPTSGEEWDMLTVEGKKRAARNVIDHIVLGPIIGKSKKLSDAADRITIVWKS